MWLWIGLAAFSCGQSKPPSSVDHLEALIDVPDSENLEQGAPMAWAEARRYLARAREMEEEGDLEQAERFASLGAIQLRIARTRTAQAATKRRMAEVELKRQALAQERDRLQFKLDKLETEIERERLRHHLTAVVEETRRSAAAAEESAERFIGKIERRALKAARDEVGYEMISRARVWRSVLEILVGQGLIDRADTSLVTGSLALAEDAMDRRDLAGVQQYVEATDIAARRLIEGAGKRPGADDAVAGLDEALKAVALEPADEEFGRAIALDAAERAPKRSRSRSAAAQRAGEVLAPFTGVHCLVLAASDGDPSSAKTTSDRLAGEVAHALTGAGIPAERVHTLGLGAAAPLSVMIGGGDRVALLLVPALEAK